MTNVPEALAAEIRRVATIREIYAQAGRDDPHAFTAPAIVLMDHALDQAVKAAGINDPLVQIPALNELKGFEL